MKFDVVKVCAGLIVVLALLMFSGVATETTWRHSGFELWGYDINMTDKNLTNVLMLDFNGTSSPGVSGGDSGTLYYDLSSQKMRISENGSLYVDAFGNISTISQGLLEDTYIQNASSRNKAIPLSYTISTDGTNYYANSTFLTDYSGTNATLVIQNALDETNTAVGGSTGMGRVLFKRGVYNIGVNTLTIYSMSIIEGESRWDTRIYGTSTDKYLFDARSKHNVVIRDLGFCNANGGAIDIHSAFIITITNNVFDGLDCAISTGNYANNLIISSNYFETVAKGMYIRGARQYSIFGNDMDHITVYGICVTKSSDIGSSVQGGTIIGNVIRVMSSGGVGIQLANNYNTVMGNYIMGCGSAGIDEVTANAYDNVIIGNVLINCSSPSIIIDTNSTAVYNLGYKSENHNNASVVNGSVISHGLAATPTSYHIISETPMMQISATANSTHLLLYIHNNSDLPQLTNINVHWDAKI